jgi:hypothetical protein
MQKETPSKQLQQRTSIYFPLALFERVKKQAEVEKRSLNREVLWILERYLEQADPRAEPSQRRPERQQAMTEQAEVQKQ